MFTMYFFVVDMHSLVDGNDIYSSVVYCTTGRTYSHAKEKIEKYLQKYCSTILSYEIEEKRLDFKNGCSVQELSFYIIK